MGLYATFSYNWPCLPFQCKGEIPLSMRLILVITLDVEQKEPLYPDGHTINVNKRVSREEESLDYLMTVLVGGK